MCGRKWKSLFFGLVAGVLVVVGCFGFNKKVVAEETWENEYLLFPSYWSNRSLFENIEYNWQGTPGQKEKFIQDYSNYSVIPKYAAEYVTFWVDSFSDEYHPSIEGIQYFKNIERIDVPISKVTDIRPLAALKKTKMMQFLTNGSVTDLRPIGQMESLEQVTLAFRPALDEDGLALTDISPLSNLKNSENIYVETNGNLQTITMKNGYRKYEVFEPIVLSSQFGGAAVEYTSDDQNFTNSDGLLKWNTVPYGTEHLTLQWEVQKEGPEGQYYYFSGDVQIPINWK